MRFSEASGRKVVSTTTAETVGKINGFVIDVSGPTLVAVSLKKTDSGDTLRWSDITAFGGDAVTVESAEKITEGGEDIAALLEKSNHVLGKRVLSTNGDELGKASDVDFDAESGTVLGLVLDSGTEVTGKRMVGIGSYAVVVQAE
jgi:uncharacterized protein YrrD